MRCREQQNEDDERLEKEVHDVVAGKRRTRRRRGGAGGLLGSDASDDESSDDEDARALRRRFAKKRRVEGDTLDALARDPATAPFHVTYQMGLVDDVDEFAHLDRDEGEGGEGDGSGSGSGVGVGVQENQNRDEKEEEEGMGDGEDGGRGRDVDEDVEMAAPSDAGKEEISAAELRKVLQNIARGKQVRLSCSTVFFPLTSTRPSDLYSGISRARPGGPVLDRPRPRRGSYDAAHARSHGVLCAQQSATACTIHTRRRRHGRALSRTSPILTSLSLLF